MSVKCGYMTTETAVSTQPPFEFTQVRRVAERGSEKCRTPLSGRCGHGRID